MSSAPPHASRQTVTEPKTSAASAPAPATTGTRRGSHSNHLGNVDARLKYLIDHVFPESPYYLTAPSDRPFNLGDRYVSNWAVGTDTVFAPEEEHLQYMTFLSHQNEETLLKPVGGWADVRGNIMPDEQPVRPGSAPQDGGQKKKKITFSDYKKKAQQGPTSKEEGEVKGKPAAAKDETASQKKEPAQQPKQRDANAPKKVDTSSKLNGGLDTPVQKLPEKPKPTAQRQATPDKSSAQSKRKVPDEDAAPSPKKKLRLSTEQLPDSEKSSEEKSKNGAPSVPELLSPTLPPSIPALLSPTLPDDLEDELANWPEKPPASSEPQSKKQSRASSKSPLASTAEKPDRPKPKSTEAGRPHSGSTSSGSSKSANVKPTSRDLATASTVKAKEHKSATSAQPMPRQPSTTRPTSPAPRQPAPRPSFNPSLTKPSAKSAPVSKSRLIVRLKYGRQNRRRVEALLKFSGKKKVPTEPPAAQQKAGASAMSRTPSEKSSSGIKRPKLPDTDDSHQPAAKRPKSATTGVADRPHTPSIQVTKPSPTTTTSSKSFSTPTTGVKGVAMRRVSSGDSHTSTPGKASSQESGSSTTEKSKKPPTSTDGQATKTPEADHRRAWRDEFHKFTAMGRELKHTAARYTENNTDTQGNKDKKATNSNHAKVAAATGIEALLCFILAFLADDQFRSLSRQPPESATWRSIIAYWQAVTRGAASYPHLHALCLFLGAVSHESIHALDLERLAVSTLPHEHSPAPTPGSDGNTVTSEESKQYKREFTELKTRLPESYREANRLWLAGARELPDDTLAKHYPHTWSGRSKSFSSRGHEKMRAGKYAGEYFLPLGRSGSTMPLEAVRFGLAFLQEWCEVEDVEWKAKLVL